MAIYEEVIECRTCKEVKPHTEFGKQKRWSITNGEVTEHLNSRQCLSCDSNDAKVRRNLEKQFPYPEKEVCDACDTDFTHHPRRKKRYLVLDHCHDTNEFRGYVCTRCNTSVGGLGDNREEILKRTEYLTPENQLKLQNKHRKKDYIPNNETKNKVKPKVKINKVKSKIKINKLCNTNSNKMEYLELLKVFVDAGELPYAMKVLNQTNGEVTKPNITKTKSKSKGKITNGRLDTTGLDSKTGEKRKARKKFVHRKLKDFDSSKNLIPVTEKWGWKYPHSIYAREDDFINAISGSLYLSPKGHKTDLYVDVDTIPATYWN